MPVTRPHIRATTESYLATHPEERHSLAGLLAVLDGPDDPSSRTTLPGHVTCSAAVVDRDGRVLHIVHRATSGKLLVPGGHLEPGDPTLLAAALRALLEEAGIPPGALCLTPQALGEPIDIDVHDIDESPAKGELKHQHYAFRFVFYLVDELPPEIALQEQEVSAARWLPLRDVTSPTLRAKIRDAGLDGRPEPVNASALIHDGAGSYLLHLRDDRPWIWEPWTLSLLGGGRERGDRNLADTVTRELSEEVPGLHLQDLKPYAVEEAISVDGLHVPIHVFSGRWNGDPDRLQLREGVLLHWVTPDQLDRLRLSPGLADLVRRHAAEQALARTVAARPVRHRGSRTVLNGVGVHLHLQDDEGRILLGLRHPDSAFAGNTWHYLSGKCEQESALTCLIREAREEAGLVIDPVDVSLAHVVHAVDAPGGPPLMQLVFRAHRWEGNPELLEPDKCLSWQWWEPTNLPEQLVDYTRAAIKGISAGSPYTELGW